jgi:predicted O-linked N-acetylglucosamine transferase (SPINDLY family)
MGQWCFAPDASMSVAAPNDPIAPVLKLLAAGEFAAAEQRSRALAASAPADPRPQALLAWALLLGGDQAGAATAIAQALALDPRSLPALLIGASIATGREDRAGAIDLLERAVGVDPTQLGAWLDLGARRLELGDAGAARGAYEQACKLAPDEPQAHLGLARALQALRGDYGAWHRARTRAAELLGTAAAQVELALDLLAAGRLDHAREACERALARDPGHLPAHWIGGLYPRSEVYTDETEEQRYRERWSNAIGVAERALDAGAVSAEIAARCLGSATSFYRHYLDQDTRREQARYARVVERLAALVDNGPPRPTRRRGDAPRRIGVCSAFLRRHTMTKLFEPLLAALPEAGFELALFYPATQAPDPVSLRLAARARQFEHGPRPLAAWIDTIRAADLDLLLHVDVGMHPVAQALAALRLAPVQVALWGHPVSTQLSSIDWFLSAECMEPGGGAESYGERLVLLPGIGACFAPPTLAPVSPALGEPGRHVEYFVAQSSYKLRPGFDVLLARIAAALPAARLHFTPSVHAHPRAELRERLRRCFATQALDFDARVGHYGSLAEAGFLGLAAACDVNLDSIGWSGGNTTLELLWFDLPPVTLPDASMRSRHTAGMLRLLELEQLIARDADDYVRIAVELGRSADFRAEMRGLIRARKHRLYDDRRVVDAFVDFIRAASASPPRV